MIMVIVSAFTIVSKDLLLPLVLSKNQIGFITTTT